MSCSLGSVRDLLRTLGIRRQILTDSLPVPGRHAPAAGGLAHQRRLTLTDRGELVCGFSSGGSVGADTHLFGLVEPVLVTVGQVEAGELLS